MAMLFADSFDYYATNELLQKWNLIFGSIQTGAIAITLDAGARSTYGVQLAHTNGVGSTGGLSLTLGNVGSTTAIVGARIMSAHFNDDGNLIGGVPGGALLTIRDANDFQLRVKPAGDGTLNVWGGGDHQYSGSTLLGTTTNALQEDGQYYIWLKAVISNTGSVVLKVNGVEWLSLPVVDTQYTANTTYKWNGVTVGPASGVNTYGYDDLVICDGSGTKNNDILAASCRVTALWPISDGAHTDWLPLSAGTHFSEVDDAVGVTGAGNDGDTSYNESETLDDVDTMIFETIPGSNIEVFGIQRNFIAKSPSSGSLAGVYRNAGSDYVGDDLALSASYLDNRDVLDLNPATATAWSVATLASPNEHGHKKTA